MPPPPPVDQGSFLVHRVTRHGETVRSLSKWYTGSEKLADEIAKASEVGVHTPLKPGQRVLIPSSHVKKVAPPPRRASAGKTGSSRQGSKRDEPQKEQLEEPTTTLIQMGDSASQPLRAGTETTQDGETRQPPANTAPATTSPEVQAEVADTKVAEAPLRTSTPATTTPANITPPTAAAQPTTTQQTTPPVPESKPGLSFEEMLLQEQNELERLRREAPAEAPRPL